MPYLGLGIWLVAALITVLVAYLVIRTAVRHGVRLALADHSRATRPGPGDAGDPPAGA